MKFSNIFRQSFIYLIGDVARRAVGFLMIPLYTGFLSPADYGTIELIELFLVITAIAFGIAAMGDSMVRVYHDYRDHRDASSVVFVALSVVASVSIAIAALGHNFAASISMMLFHSPEQAPLISYALLAMVFSNIVELLLVYQRMKERTIFFAVASLAQAACSIGLNLWFIAGLRMGMRGFIFSKMLTTGVSAAILLCVVLREIRWRFHFQIWRDLTKFGLPLVLSSASLFTIHFADRFFLSRYGTLEEVGIYALAYRFGFLVTYLVGEPFGRVWGVNLYAYVSDPRWNEKFGRIVAYLAFLLFLVALGLTLSIDKVLPMISAPAFAAGARLVPVLAFGYVAREMGDFFRGLLFINKQTKIFGLIAGVCAVANLVLNYLWIRPYGATGAAAATFVTWLIYIVLVWSRAAREHKVPYSVWSFGLLTVLTAATYLVSRLLIGLSVGLQAAGDLLLVVGFMTAAWIAGYFPPSEQIILRDTLVLRSRAVFARASSAR